jgi:hypothetical protein
MKTMTLLTGAALMFGSGAALAQAAPSSGGAQGQSATSPASTDTTTSATPAASNDQATPADASASKDPAAPATGKAKPKDKKAKKDTKDKDADGASAPQ